MTDEQQQPSPWLEPGETCLVSGNGTCEANARKGTGTGMCDRPLDVHGLCDRAADHVDGSTGCGA